LPHPFQRTPAAHSLGVLQEVHQNSACRPFFFMWRDMMQLAGEGHDPQQLLGVSHAVWLSRCGCSHSRVSEVVSLATHTRPASQAAALQRYKGIAGADVIA
jgi:hypothetical protein